MSGAAWFCLFAGIAVICGLVFALRERREERIAREARQQEQDPDSWGV